MTALSKTAVTATDYWKITEAEFQRLDAFPVAQQTVSKHWTDITISKAKQQ